MKSVKFITLGCKVNQYDTQGIRERFAGAGFKEIYNGRKADIYVINTCTVTSSADSKSRHFINYAHRRNPRAKIVVTGCYATLDSDRIRRIPGVTHVIKNKDRDKIIRLLSEGGKAGATKGPATGISDFSGHTRAFLKIQDGCDNRCSYCKVPLVRGASRSSRKHKVIREARMLAENGFKEIVLCGICLGSYGKDLSSGESLVDIIGELERIEGITRIRLSSIEAGDVSEDLIRRMARSGKLCRHLHIPIQSGDDKILKRMNRKYGRRDYLGLISKIKKAVPDTAITTDIMVGFPGEEESNFRNSVDLIGQIAPLRTHIFPYSRRPGTPAAILNDTLAPAVIKERVSRLREAANRAAFEYKRGFLNKELPVLIEGRSRGYDNCWEGHTDNYIKVRVNSSADLKNRIFRVRLDEADANKDCIEGVFVVK